MKRLVFLVLILCMSKLSVAQECIGQFIFHHQSDMDNFLQNNPGCTTIIGDVIIEPQNTGGPDDLLSVDGLQNITNIQGNLSIGFIGNNSSFVFSLASLNNLVTVSGALFIGDQAENPHIMSLQGFESLTSCEELFIENCYGVETLEPLYQLQQTTGISCVWGYAIPKSISLTNLFPNLTSVSGAIAFDGASYPEFSGFDNLLSANSISITQNDLTNDAVIGSFDAFHNLLSCFSLTFDNLDITTMHGFNQLQSCTYLSILVNSPNPYWEFESLTFAHEIQLENALSCEHTPSFTSLTNLDSGYGGIRVTGLFENVIFSSLQTTGYFDVFGSAAGNGPTTIQCPNLLAIHGDLYIAHTNVSDLNFLNNISPLGAFVNIIGNHNLSVCDQWVLCYKVANEPFNVTIYDNAIGCYDNEDVANNCNYASAEGNIFVDLNCDGVFNDPDYNYPLTAILQNQDGQLMEIYNPDYNYYIPLSENAQTISLVTPEGFTCNNTYTYPANDEGNYIDQNFALCPEPNLNNIEVVIIPYQIPRPGFSNGYYVRVSNVGINDAVAQVSIDFSNTTGLNIVDVSGNSSVNGNIVTWTTPIIPAFDFNMIFIDCQLDVSVPLGEIYVIDASAEILTPSVNDSYPNNNQTSIIQTVIGSYDPNDISVNQTHINAEVLNSGNPIELEYMIRFQNTGTASAINVRIQNPLSEFLDPSTLRVVANSHDYVVEMNSEHELTWRFDNIDLPDSNSNEPLSHGFIVYRVRTTSEVIPEDSITNYANIFFDFNLPILTNTAVTSFYDCPSSAQIIAAGQICQNESVTLECIETYDQFVWTANGDVIGQGPYITFTNSDPGEVIVELEASTEHCSSAVSHSLLVYPTPQAPTVSIIDNTLSASGIGEFHWLVNGVEIQSNEPVIEITESGTFEVYSILNGCSSPITTGQFTVISVTETITATDLIIYPQPAIDDITILFNGSLYGAKTVEFLDISGKIVYSAKIQGASVILDCSKWGAGLYFCRIKNEENEIITKKKFVVE